MRIPDAVVRLFIRDFTFTPLAYVTEFSIWGLLLYVLVHFLRKYW